MKTIGISLWDGQVRAGGNAQTVMRPAVHLESRRRATSRDLFLETYAKFAGACRSVEEPGLAIIAVDERTQRAAGIVKLMARVGRPVAAIAGRHDRCDLYLRGNDSLALRQFAVVLGPVESWAASSTKVHYRVIDLRTSDGMFDEDGRMLRGLRAEGAAILRSGGYTFFVLPLGDPSDWPERADDAWQTLPERVYFDEMENCADGSHVRLTLPRDEIRQSRIFRTVGPRDTSPGHTGVIGTEHDLAGRLEITGPRRQVTMNVGQDALRDGVLLGRYGRCDISEAIEDPSLSRVHALLVHEQDRLVIIDTASYNGTRIVGEHRARLIELEHDLELQLGKQTRLRWRWLG
ncbi:MAG: FHA domain-containing protein [Deltaproteobacteria bacterium]|nr:FHA domain-containing protein [Deltaproteobacteria bacterium]MDQ3297718.1 FHA domain-containing protein [Myxococcota bacterium]